MTVSNGLTTSSTPGVIPNEVVIESDNKRTASYRMVAVDLDGTLLHSNHIPSDETCEYLRRLDSQGFTIVIATGRAASTVFETVRKLALSNPIHVVCSNGARGIVCTVNQEDGSISFKELFLTTIPDAVARKTIQLAKDLGHVSQYYVEQDVYADPRMDHHFELTELYKKLTGSQTIYVKDDFEKAIQRGLPSKQLVFCRTEEQDDMIAAFEKEFQSTTTIRGFSATIVRGNLGWFLEVLHPDVNKGHGLQKMCDYLQISIKEVIAFGDGDNDYEFIRMAGKGIVMKNGRDVVKKVADQVIDMTNNEDGVRKTLQQMEGDGLLIFAEA